MHVRAIVFLAILLMGSGIAVVAQVNEYPFSKVDIRDGLSNNQVSTIYKDQKGFLWFGTIAGLNRYDGYTCKVFRHDDADSASINDDYIYKIFEGPEEKLWISTTSGFNIYDAVTEKFDRHPERFYQSAYLPVNTLTDLLRLNDTYCFVFADSGVCFYTGGKRTGWIRPGTGNGSILTTPVVAARLDSKGTIWLVHYDGVMEQWSLGQPGGNRSDGKGADGSQPRLLSRITAVQKANIAPSHRYSLFIDRQDQCWLYEEGKLTGLYLYDPVSGALTHYSRDSGRIRLSSQLVNDVVQDDKGMIWIATDHGGVNLLDKQHGTIRYLLSTEEERSIAQNSITRLYKDNFGIIWLGTYKKGINYYQENIIRFPLYRHQPAQPGSLPYDDVNRFAEDKKGNLWIGTNGGGLIYYDRTKNSFSQYRHEPGNPNSLSNDVVVGLRIDRTGKLWIGTYLGGLDCWDGSRFTHHQHNDADARSLADDAVNHIFEDSDGELWIGMILGGLDRYDRQKNVFYHNNPSVPNSLHSGYITSMTEDRDGNLWIGTGYGIDVLQKSTGKFLYYTDLTSKLSYNNVNDFCRDHNGNMWVATQRGLNCLALGTDTFQAFFIKDGLPDNIILNILEDDDHYLWVSTPNGLSRITVTQNGGHLAVKCLNYNEYDGLQGRAFNENASFKTNKGELIFGGSNGFNLFKPSDIHLNEQPPPVVLTSFNLFNRPMEAGQEWNGHVVLTKAIMETDEVVLNYNENDFSLEFAALSFANTNKNKYAYLLEGFNKDWIVTDGKARKAFYTNIDPGEYVFRVKASNNDGVWNEKGLAIRIIVTPPFWKTKLAYVIYALLFITLLYFARLFIIRRTRARFALAQERQEALRMHELDMMKIKFLTNVSHEFRTPLSLIMAPIDKLLQSSKDPAAQKQYNLIQRNAKRLLHLVNQLLDFRKMEVNELKLNRTQGDIIPFIRDISYSFTDLAEKKNITFDYHEGIAHLFTAYDADKIERILFNLLSNAFKFTSGNGKVSITVNIAEREGADVLLEIRVADTGIGIPPEMQQKIFETFFQHKTPESILNQGSGIGLAITREFIEMHGGQIRVESEVDKGSCFTVLLPLLELPAEAIATGSQPGRGWSAEDGGLLAESFKEGLEEAQLVGNPSEGVLPEGAMETGVRLRILLVEDNEDFRFYLKDNLKDLFTIIEAANGKEGWQRCLSAHPDLVVSDISMPLMDGAELCRKIKTDARTRHIPVILLTALSGEQDQIRALENGPNDYITKPFNFEILLSRIRNLLQYKESVKKTYQKQLEVKPGEIAVDSTDREEDFIKQAVSIIDANMANPDFGVEEWRQALLLSRTSLYKKIVTLTGKTPIEFIRTIRLQRSAQLLERTQHNIAEIAYMVGFNNPKYFARYFKEEFGMLPSAYQLKHGRKNRDDHAK